MFHQIKIMFYAFWFFVVLLVNTHVGTHVLDIYIYMYKSIGITRLETLNVYLPKSVCFYLFKGFKLTLRFKITIFYFYYLYIIKQLPKKKKNWNILGEKYWSIWENVDSINCFDWSTMDQNVSQKIKLQ